MSDPTYRLLLEMAGRVDDDLLATGRELVAVGEEGHALELLVAELVAGRVMLPPAVRRDLVAEAAARRVQPDADRYLPHDVLPGDGCPHRFTADGTAGGLARTLAEVPAPGGGWTVAWRVTPAGSAPGPLPHPVLLARTTGDGSAEVLTYQAQSALTRAGMVASVEVHDGEDPDTEYHRVAREVAQPLPAGHGDRSADAADPVATHPGPADHAPAEPTVTEPPMAEPSVTEPPVAEPSPTGPGTAEPAAAGEPREHAPFPHRREDAGATGEHARPPGDLPSSTGAGPAPGAGTFDVVVPGPGAHRPDPALTGPPDEHARAAHPAPRPSPPIQALRQATSGDWFDPDDHTPGDHTPDDGSATAAIAATGPRPAPAADDGPAADPSTPESGLPVAARAERPAPEPAPPPGPDHRGGRVNGAAAAVRPHRPAPAFPAAGEEAWQQDWASGSWAGDVAPEGGPDGPGTDAPTPPSGVPITQAPEVPASGQTDESSRPRHLLLAEDAGEEPGTAPGEHDEHTPAPAEHDDTGEPAGSLADRLSPTEQDLLQRLHEELAVRETDGEPTPRNGTARPDLT